MGKLEIKISYIQKSIKSSQMITKYNIKIAMRHGIRTKRLSRPLDQRNALLRSLVTSVLKYGKVKTTVVRAKYTKKYVDRIISSSKKKNLNARRKMEAFIYDKKLVKSILTDAPIRYANREGGYSRVIREQRLRKGDSAKLATIELV